MLPVLLQDAFQAAQNLLDAQVRPEHGPEVVIASCEEFPNAWVFGYNTRRFLSDMEIAESLVGNGPVVVPKSGRAPFLGLAARPIDEQLFELE